MNCKNYADSVTGHLTGKIAVFRFSKILSIKK